MARSWERDELILALDLYFRVGARVSSNDPAVVQLSEFLRGLPLNEGVPRARTYRSADSVHLKLQNFLSMDPAYHGKGMAHASQADRRVWKEFAADRTLVSRIATQLRESSERTEASQGMDEEDEDEFPEGRILYRVHRRHERSRALARKMKRRWLKKYDNLACLACGFDFEETYGPRGREYTECHHIVPVSELRSGARTRVQDLIPVCSNCHRMLHRARPWLSVAQLKTLMTADR